MTEPTGVDDHNRTLDYDDEEIIVADRRELNTPATTPATTARWSRRSHDGVDDHRDQYALEVRLE